MSSVPRAVIQTCAARRNRLAPSRPGRVRHCWNCDESWKPRVISERRPHSLLEESHLIQLSFPTRSQLRSALRVHAPPSPECPDSSASDYHEASRRDIRPKSECHLRIRERPDQHPAAWIDARYWSCQRVTAALPRNTRRRAAPWSSTMARLESLVLCHRQAAFAHERDGHRVGAYAVARRCCGGQIR